MVSIIIPVVILLGIGLIFGVVLALANTFLEVKVDSRIEDIAKMLPNYNCGACGTPGCGAFAEGIVNGEVKKLSACKPGKPDKNFNLIIEYLKNHPNADGSIINVSL